MCGTGRLFRLYGAVTGHLVFGAGAVEEQGVEQMAAGFTVSLEPAGGLGPFYAN